MSAPLTTRRLAGSIAAAVLSLWLGFAIVAGVNNPSQPRPSPAPAGQESAPTRLILRTAPALRVRPALLESAAAASTARHAASTARHAATSARRAPATTAAARAPSTAPATAASAPEPPPAAPQPTSAGRPAPWSSPAPKPRPSITAKPKQPTKPDFDDSAPGGFDNSG